MPKQPVKAEVNSFVKGLISEASPLNFPPNCSLDEENFELNRDGTRSRRIGFDLEPNHVLRTAPTSTDIDGPAPVNFRWNEAGGISGYVVLVVQIDNSLTFYDLSKESISSEGFLSSILLTDFPLNTQYSFASVDGKLVVAVGLDRLAVISLTPSGTFQVSYDTLKTRDLWGVEGTDAEGIKYEKDSRYRGQSSPFHRYNLQNQSWGVARKDSSGNLRDPVQIYYNQYNVYPSNTEEVWPGLQYQPVTVGDPFERVYPSLYLDVLGGDTKASRGYYIIDVVNRGASRVTALVENYARNGVLLDFGGTLPVDYTEGGCTVAAEFSGRVFYAGFSGKTVGGDGRSPNLSNYVFFSQLVRSPSDFFKCYSEGDPTSRENSDIVDTDGGFIRLAGADRILSMVNVASSLIVICSNGVWAISGGNEYGFTATNYKVTKLSTFGGISRFSVVSEKARVFYWANEGIYVIAKDQSGSLVCESLSDSTIQTIYQEIPSDSKEKSIGQYDSVNKKVRWLYVSSSGYDCELVFDLLLGAFYKNRIYPLLNYSARVVSMFESTLFNSVSTVDSIYVAGDSVLSNTDEVVIDTVGRSSSFQSIKYLCITRVDGIFSYSFGFYRNTDFKDWQRLDGTGVDAKAYILTGFQIAGDSSIQKQAQYLTVHFDNTTELESSCLGRMQWDWSGSASSNKWSALKQLFRYTKSTTEDLGFNVVTTKNMVRGRGRSFALYMETEDGKDCQILGWSISADANTKV
jgi:hypothetical protein